MTTRYRWLGLPSHRPALAFLGFSLLGARPAGVAAQSADSSSSELSALIAALSPASIVRIATAGERWTGRLAASLPDSLVLITEAGRRAVRLASVDSVWARGPQRHHGLLAGAGFGALMFGLLQLKGNSAEDPGLNTRLGLVLLAGSTALGLLVDAASDRWVQRYPGKP
jgi:hypothetical protein